MKPSKTSKAWMREHVDDFYVKRARQEGFRSRAAFKLLEIDDRDHLLKPGMTVVDLGAAPGGWSQAAASKVGAGGRVLAVDLLEIAAIPGVTTIKGDVRDAKVLTELRRLMGGGGVDLVISDMAPHITGIDATDQANSVELVELALEFAGGQLKPGGNFLVKAFQGDGFEGFLQQMRARFKRVVTRKPKSSRGRSSEIYLLGLGKLPDKALAAGIEKIPEPVKKSLP